MNVFHSCKHSRTFVQHGGLQIVLGDLEDIVNGRPFKREAGMYSEYLGTPGKQFGGIYVNI